MRTAGWLSLTITALVVGLIAGAALEARLGTVAEGVLFNASWTLTGDRAGGLTRINNPEAVPGGNGSWNVDARGRLTRQYLIITYPARADLGPQAIPVERLLSVQFGDGGISEVKHPAGPR